MHTSSFFVYKGNNGISIARWSPAIFKGPAYRALAPGTWFKSVDQKTYIDLYVEQLKALDPEKVWDELHKISPEPVLLCWEKPGEFCHRRIVAKWFEKKLGVHVPEL